MFKKYCREKHLFFFREVLVGVQPDDFISQQELRRGYVMMGVYGWRASWPIAAGRTRNSEGRGNFGWVTTSLHEKRLYVSEVGMKWRAELKFALPGLQLDTRTSLLHVSRNYTNISSNIIHNLLACLELNRNRRSSQVGRKRRCNDSDCV